MSGNNSGERNGECIGVDGSDVQTVEWNDSATASELQPQVDEYFDTLNTYVRMCARGEITSMIVESPPGIGKSHQIEETLKEEREMDEDESSCFSYDIKQGYVSPMSLYETLYYQQAANNVLVLDDVDNVADNDTAASLLKGATEGQGSSNRRIVEWDSNSNRLDDGIPERFEFKGSIIMCFNDVPNGNMHFEAVKSRAMDYKLQFSYEERIDLIQEVAKAPYKDTTIDDRMEVAEWLTAVATKGTQTIDLRSLFKCLDLYGSSVLSDDSWKPHAAEQLGISKAELRATEILNEHDSIRMAAIEFAESTRYTTERFFEELGEQSEIDLAAELDNEFDYAERAIETWESLTAYDGKTTYYRRKNQAKDL